MAAGYQPTLDEVLASWCDTQKKTEPEPLPGSDEDLEHLRMLIERHAESLEKELGAEVYDEVACMFFCAILTF